MKMPGNASTQTNGVAMVFVRVFCSHFLKSPSSMRNFTRADKKLLSRILQMRKHFSKSYRKYLKIKFESQQKVFLCPFLPCFNAKIRKCLLSHESMLIFAQFSLSGPSQGRNVCIKILKAVSVDHVTKSAENGNRERKRKAQFWGTCEAL